MDRPIALSTFEPDENVPTPKIPFTELLLAANAFAPEDFQNWVFRKEMLFGATDKWWGDFGQRDFPHEGVDFCLYADHSGRIGRLKAGTRIPVMHDGVVRAVFKDYLGQAVIIEHEVHGDPHGKYISAYAHTLPEKGMQPGKTVRRGDLIATIADTRNSKAKILPHLHLSSGRISPKLRYENFVWNIMRDADLVALRDPMALFDLPYGELDAGFDLYREGGAVMDRSLPLAGKNRS
jgi:murein DD-endopeptidase MepM/ murein hydrolase activator NlpD